MVGNLWLEDNNIRGFMTIAEDHSFLRAARYLILCTGIDKMRPNMLLLGFKNDWKTCSAEEIQEYYDIINEGICFVTSLL